MSVPLRLLMIEDAEDDAELIRIELERAGFELEWRCVDTEDAFRRALEEYWDLIICDFQMPQFDGLRAFALYKEHDIDTPFIFVSGALGEERAVEAMRSGARDYLLKGNLARLSVAVKRELREARNRASQQRAELAAQREQRRLMMAVEASGAGIFEHRVPVDQETYLSERCASILGYALADLPSCDRLLDWIFDHVHPEDVTTLRSGYVGFVDGSTERYELEFRMRDKAGNWIDVACFAKAVARSRDGRAMHVVGVALDRTEHRKLESQLRHAQKMEGIGRLAGGVAHDFNNLLTVIVSFGHFVLETMKADDTSYHDMQEVLKAAAKAESLTNQLLAFSRRKPVVPRVLCINDVVSDLDRMLRRIVGEDVDVSTVLASDLWNVRVDPGSLEQVILNLAVNARDAMPGGGRLTIETMNTELDAEYGRKHGANVLSGEYSVIAVSDDGTGMDEDTQRSIFEPFFTTKGPGKGTGLGLSTCYGIVKQANGYIWVYSELGAGTTFKIYLPRATEGAEDARSVSDPSLAQGLDGTETILVAEDDEQVRELTTRALRKLGYEVIAVPSGAEALTRFQASSKRIHLLLADVVMPEMSGKVLAEKLQREGMRVLYMSGYTANAIMHRGVLDPNTHMLQKPFTPEALARKVREVLDE